MQKNDNRVLVAALDWGLGHATRTVPLIRQLQAEGKNVILASTGTAFEFYRSYFPELELNRKPGYDIKYFKGFPLLLSIFLQVPAIIYAISREHFWLKKIIRSEGISTVISDNCYGLWNKNVKTIFITHQLSIVCPAPFQLLEPFLRFFIKFFIRKFDECHVPDYPGENNLSGRLSHFSPLPSNVAFIGPLSRFTDLKSDSPLSQIEIQSAFDVVILLSGPEPQRSLFENKCIQILKGKNINACIVRGKPGENHLSGDENIKMYNHLNDGQLAKVLGDARKIICRSGYSTIMDLHALKLSALLVPTEGQTEQEYLADFHSTKGTFETIAQEELNFENVIESSK